MPGPNDSDLGPVAAVISCCRRLDALGLIAGIDGNVSTRAGDLGFWITRAGVRKSNLTASDVVRVDENGNVLEGAYEPSSEVQMHLEVYRSRTEIRAVVHAHPPVATGFGVAGIPLDVEALPEVILSMGQVPLVPFEMPGSSDLGRVVGETAKTHNAMLLANHGAVTMGRSIEEALSRMESLEHGAKILWVARSVGKVSSLDSDVLRQLKNVSTGSNPVEEC